MCVNLEESYYQLPRISNQKKVENKVPNLSPAEIELGPGKSYNEGYKKKPLPGHQNAPNSEQEIAAPSNIIIKTNIPRESNPEDLKKEAPLQQK